MRMQEYLRTASPVGIKSAGDLHYNCPYCKGRRKLEVSKTRGLWHCHKCKRGGRLDRVSVHMQDNSESVDLSQFKPVSKGSLQWQYLECRGYTDECIRDLRPHKGPQVFMVYFPFYQMTGNRPIYFIGRTLIDGTEPKYYNLQSGRNGVRASGVLWGMHRIRRPCSHVVLCEGILDAVWGANRLAILGKSLSECQTRLVKGLDADRITVFLDGTARKEAVVIASRLAKETSAAVYYAECPYESDPGELGESGDKYIDRAWRIA